MRSVFLAAFASVQRNRVKHPSVAPSGRAGMGEPTLPPLDSRRVCRTDSSCLPFLAVLKYRRRRKRKGSWAVCGACGGGVSEGIKMNETQY